MARRNTAVPQDPPLGQIPDEAVAKREKRLAAQADKAAQKAAKVAPPPTKKPTGAKSLDDNNAELKAFLPRWDAIVDMVVQIRAAWADGNLSRGKRQDFGEMFCANVVGIEPKQFVTAQEIAREDRRGVHLRET